jgi:succinate dehydrogenase/fumarate reductase flavoprotein subunit
MANRDEQAELLIVGSGAAALVAAIAAHDAGVAVRIVERTDLVGGAAAVSGGGLWVPLNHLGGGSTPDSREEALAYARRLTDGRADDARVVNFIDSAPRVLRYLTERTPARFSALDHPDYQLGQPGAKIDGRMVEPTLFDTATLGEWALRLRRGRVFGLPMQLAELVAHGAMVRPQNLPMDVIADRMQRGLVAAGGALVGMLLRACLDREIPIGLNTRVLELVRDGRRVVGAVAERDGATVAFGASAVLLATGGYEWNADLRAKFLPGRLTHPASPPGLEGDGLVMAMEVGADLGNMTEAWWFPTIADPAESYDGQPLSRLCFAERIAPHSMMVNRRGRRFVNEAANYNDMSKAFQYFDPNDYDYANLPCWAILDGQHRANYSLGTSLPGMPDPEWVISDDTPAGLAAKVGIDPEGLLGSLVRFNEFARAGKDPDFGRGESWYDRYLGDRESPHPNLGTIERPPFYAVPIHPGALGTKGGPKVDTLGRVLDVRGRPIPGLYGAGNVVAGLSGPGYYGAGTTLAIAVTEGFVSGETIAEDLAPDRTPAA